MRVLVGIVTRFFCWLTIIIPQFLSDLTVSTSDKVLLCSLVISATMVGIWSILRVFGLAVVAIFIVWWGLLKCIKYDIGTFSHVTFFICVLAHFVIPFVHDLGSIVTLVGVCIMALFFPSFKDSIMLKVVLIIAISWSNPAMVIVFVISKVANEIWGEEFGLLVLLCRSGSIGASSIIRNRGSRAIIPPSPTPIAGIAGFTFLGWVDLGTSAGSLSSLEVGVSGSGVPSLSGTRWFSRDLREFGIRNSSTSTAVYYDKRAGLFSKNSTFYEAIASHVIPGTIAIVATRPL